MFNTFIAMFRPRFAGTIIYMLQATEYDVAAYLKWFWRTNDFSKIMYRRRLVKTRPARILLVTISAGMVIEVMAAIIIAVMACRNHSAAGYLLALGTFLATPILWPHFISLPLLLGRWLIINPRYKDEIRRSKKTFAGHAGVRIAIAGSYGKTTMKEILLAVLSEAKTVAATPANKNVAISHARFAKSLKGNEEVLIIEYGEGSPGDVARFSRSTQPNIGVITGLAPAHLDKYKTLERAGQDIFSLADYLNGKDLYVNDESEAVKPFLKKNYLLYDSKQAAGWKISNIKNALSGVSFAMIKGKVSLKLTSSLIGRHQVGPLAAAAALAHQLGLSASQIEAGIAKIPAFEHRMQPYQISGAWVIDDTYNGNIEGMRAGLELLKELPAKRKIYITPGLVDQGAKSSQIHQQLGTAIAQAQPDLVILMKHSVTEDIVKGLEKSKFKGELLLEEDPLNFYTNLDKFVAAGDLVLMQNDWPDNYN